MTDQVLMSPHVVKQEQDVSMASSCHHHPNERIPVKLIREEDVETAVQEAQHELMGMFSVEEEPSVQLLRQYVMPKCVLPPAEEFGPVEAFVATALASRHDTSHTTSSNTTSNTSNKTPSNEASPHQPETTAMDMDMDATKAAYAYQAVVDCLRKKDDPQMLLKVLLALRTSGHGTTLHLLSCRSGSSTHVNNGTKDVHAHLLHRIFKFDPFYIPKELKKELDSIQAQMKAIQEEKYDELGLRKSKSHIQKQLVGLETSLQTTLQKLEPYQNFALANAYLHLVVALVSANSVFLTPAMNALWKIMLPYQNDNVSTMDDKQRRYRILQTMKVHAALATMLRLCPKGKSDLFPIIASNYPFKLKSAELQIAYAKQCLHVLRYVPTIHGQVLGLLLDKGLEMDVEIKIQDGGQVTLEEDHEDDEQQRHQNTNDVDAIFELDEDDDTNNNNVNDKAAAAAAAAKKENEKVKTSDVTTVDEFADKLDLVMRLVFEHLQQTATSSRSSTHTPKLTPRDLFRMMSPVFDSSILTTHRSKFVQFSILLICGLDATRPSLSPKTTTITNNGNATHDSMAEQQQHQQQPKLYREFAAKLIHFVLDPYRATVTRQSSVCYLASFLSRASFVCAETACESISALLSWAEKYMETVGGGSVPLLSSSYPQGNNSHSNGRLNHLRCAVDRRSQCEMHSLFYTVCQAAFYIMCFRGSEAIRYYRSAQQYYEENDVDALTDDDDIIIPYPELAHIDIGPSRWSRLCSHNLQPLNYCLESVRGEFLHLADIFDLFQSPDLLEHLVLEDQKLASGILKRQQLQERRKRSIIQTAATLEKKRLKGGVGGLGRGSNPLDSFFPFDPYLLRRSYPYIEPYYRNWEGSAQVEDLTTSLLDDNNDEDIMLTDARNNEHISDDEDGSDSEDGESNEDTDDDDDDDNDEDSDQDDGEHMPLSLDTTADGSVMMHKPMSYTSTSSSLQNNNDKMATQRELWENELKRSRAASIGSGSW